MTRLRKAVLAFLFIASLFGAPSASAASDPGLYFDSVTFDYYLEKTDTGTKMKVKETYEAVFSATSSSHGLTRAIPFTNQNGQNITIDNLNLTVTRNGVSEPIAKTEKKDGYFEVNIGSGSKTVQGKQTYVLEYEFQNVITEYNAAGELTTENPAWQELYWDTNGIGWPNKFNSVIANVHFVGDYNAKTPTYCYTGARNSNAKNCTVEQTSDGFTFKTTAPLSYYENLTFDIEFPAGTFKVPVNNNYILLIFTSAAALFGALSIFFSLKKYRKYAKEKYQYSENLLVAPQYTPMKDLTVAEAGEIYLGTSRPTQTATILELATTHKIQIIAEKTTTKVLKSEKTLWKIKVLETDGLTEPQKDVLKILNGGNMPEKDETFEIKKQTATRALADLSADYPKSARKLLKQKSLLEENVNITTGAAKTTKEASLATLFLILLLLGCLALTFFLLDKNSNFLSYGRIFGRNVLPFVIWGVSIFTMIIYLYMNRRSTKFLARTNQGLEASNYLEGLKLYISMAEKDRLAFNQSAKSAPKDDKDLVRLYEKLLPYACLFGLEETWLKEIQKYYDALNYAPDWYYGDDVFTYAMFYSMMNTTSSTISSNTSWQDSSSSSSFSGGGGGGGGGGSW